MDHCIYAGGSKTSMDYEVNHYLEFNDVEEIEFDYYVNGRSVIQEKRK